MAKRRQRMRTAPIVISAVALAGFGGALAMALYHPQKPAQVARIEPPRPAPPAPPPVVAALPVAAPSPPPPPAPTPLRKMSSAEWRLLDTALGETLKRCWTATAKSTTPYVPKLKVAFAPDGSIQGRPVLLNPSADPAAKKVAAGAIDALGRCTALPVPPALNVHYAEWQTRIVRFTPANYDPNQTGG